MASSPEPEPLVVPDQIDFQAVANWLSRCDQHHGSKCRTRRFANTVPPDSGGIYLLDVTRGSVAPASLDERFIALSYVWGGLDQLKMLKSNRDALAEAGALEGEAFRHRIGKTLRDAIAVVRALGERYLWIDALCICQDDPEHKRAQINQMAAIYDAAMLTIVACTAQSSDSPLPGVGPGTRLTPEEPDRDLNVRFMASLARSPHSKRAWTFQEVILSRRCLFFFRDRVFFHCQQSGCEEGGDDVEVRLPKKQLGNWPPLEATFMPRPSRYSDLVVDYTRGLLTFPADRLDAFSALTSALETAWGWSFCYALPLQNFSEALLWTPQDPVAYRTLGRESLPLATEYLFPSWSWLSYPGQSRYRTGEWVDMSYYIDWRATYFWDGQRVQTLGTFDDHQDDASQDFPPDKPSDSLPNEDHSDNSSGPETRYSSRGRLKRRLKSKLLRLSLRAQELILRSRLSYLRLSRRLSKLFRKSDDLSDELSENSSDELSENSSDELSDNSSDELSDNSSNELSDNSSDNLSDTSSDSLPYGKLSDHIPQHDLLHSLSDDLCEGLPPGTLLMSAWTACLEALGEAPDSREMWFIKTLQECGRMVGEIYTPLVNPQGKWYGTLLGISESQLRSLLQQENPKLLKLVLLSTCSSPWVVGGKDPTPCFDRSEYKVGDWCTMNVLLIASNPGERHYRRLAIGEIHKDEQDKMSFSFDLVYLA